MEMVTGFLVILFALAFAYVGLDYAEKYFTHGWRPGWRRSRPRMVSRDQAAEDQPDWADYAAWLRNRYDR